MFDVNSSQYSKMESPLFAKESQESPSWKGATALKAFKMFHAKCNFAKEISVTRSIYPTLVLIYSYEKLCHIFNIPFFGKCLLLWYFATSFGDFMGFMFLWLVDSLSKGSLLLLSSSLIKLNHFQK